MPRTHTKQELANLALANSAALTLRSHNGLVYEARDFEHGTPAPQPERSVWIELKSDDIMDMAKSMGILFTSRQEFQSYQFMVEQSSERVKDPAEFVVIKHDGGLAFLTDYGVVPLVNPVFSPNFINYSIIGKDDDNYSKVTELFAIMSDWLGGEEQAHSLLYHLATALQPGYAARKYVLLLGGGSNGKSTLLKMLMLVLGETNVSGIMRQDIAARRPIIRDLNNKLANIVMDGPEEYVKESSPEKTLTAGEPLVIEIKYENHPVRIQTNALFIEGLQKEPKARDKSAALQNRIVRFYFPNEYEKDLGFEDKMQSRDMINALLTLMYEHWVDRSELAHKLAITQKSQDLRTSYVMDRSAVLAWIEVTARKDHKLIEQILSGKYNADTMVTALQPWMTDQGYEGRNATAVWEQLADHFVIERKTMREGGKPVTRRIISRVLPDTQRALKALEGALDDDETVVRGD